ncbi:hypothetical protein [Abyssisolibacter fermentans]|uniref:hypothetical protein n=1 Tax=Abyssisolibacter fermentans TaxID=1766203 RepID=UPI00083270AD|nr:hypothetical protein [Abyssisolibacter fermentans]
MKFITPIYLVTNEVDVFESIPKDKLNKVYASEESISQREFYKGQSAGFKLEKKLEVRYFEYKEEEYLIYDNELFKILRAYKNESKGIYELTCIKENSRVVIDG